MVLAPLSPQEVHQDQVKLNLRRQEANDKEKSPDGKKDKEIHLIAKNSAVKKAMYLQKYMLFCL